MCDLGVSARRRPGVGVMEGAVVTQEQVHSADDLSGEHVLALVGAYERTLDGLGYSPVVYPDTSQRCGGTVHMGTKYDCLNHAFWMCGRIRRFAAERSTERAMRWLGTVQGMLIMGGVFSIDEIMSHDRTPPAFRAPREHYNGEG